MSFRSGFGRPEGCALFARMGSKFKALIAEFDPEDGARCEFAPSDAAGGGHLEICGVWFSCRSVSACAGCAVAGALVLVLVGCEADPPLGSEVTEGSFLSSFLF